MNKILSLLLLLIAAFANAQVGIGTTSPNAILDIRSSNQATPANTDGILVPKVDAFPVTAPTALQNGMLVFLTITSGSYAPGFYYWNNATATWIGFAAAASGWSVTGNDSTNASSNFLGTTDNIDIVFKRNGIRSGFIGDPNTSTGNKNTSFGANTLNSTLTGTRNTVFGSNILSLNTTGFLNVAVGDQTMFSNTNGSENVAIGTGALYKSAAGVCNVAIGRNALTATNGMLGAEGSNNTAVGYVAMRFNTLGAYNSATGRESLFSNLTGNYNVGLGYQSGYTNSAGSNNVFIGNQAGYNETLSGKLYIENSNADASNALIYGDFSSSPKVLRTNSQFQIGDAATTGYKFPVGRGNNKQVLETDASGTLSWANGLNNLSVVRTTLGGTNQLLSSTGWQKINFNTKIFDTNTEFDTALSRFVATKAGYYQINAGFHTDIQNNIFFYGIGVRVNNGFYQEVGTKHASADIVSRQINCIVNLAVGDYVEIFVNNPQIGVSIDGYSGKTFFEIQQIR